MVEYRDGNLVTNNADLEKIAVKLGVSPTIEDINQRIDELDQNHKGLMEVIAGEVGCSKVETIDILDGDRQILVDKVVEFRKKYWKLQARSDHLHKLAYQPLWKLIPFRAYLFFVYPVKRLFEKKESENV